METTEIADIIHDNLGVGDTIKHTKKEIQEIIDKGKYYIVYQEQNVAGFGMIKDLGIVYEIGSIVVLKQFLGSGLLTNIIDGLISICPVDKPRCVVTRNNHIIERFIKIGFKEIDTEDILRKECNKFLSSYLLMVDAHFTDITEAIKFLMDNQEPKDKIEFRNKLLSFLHEQTQSYAPVDDVQRIPHEKVVANDYNPNSVANKELKLLYTSIKEDGYTQPVVTIYDEERDLYVIVDGFHRYFVMRMNKDIYDLYHGMLPCVVIKKDINQRMASTVRHNRARGHHSVDGMGNLVFQMLANGWSDEVICNKLGLEVEELLRLKHITGFSKLFENTEYSKSWETEQQIEHKKNFYTKGEVEEVEVEDDIVEDEA